ncbi:MAG: DUF2764 family protein [Lentisphaerae bacterium]|nr:DUF2764 family protein [Lentisphaerota bacterium]
MNYTYLAASLPTLVFGAPPSFGVAEFRAKCEGVLSRADLAALDALLTGAPAPGVRFVAEWQARETQLRNGVARARAAHLGVEARPYLRDHAGWDMSVAKAVTDAFAKPNPLEREQELDRCRWRTAEDLARFEPFGLPAVLAFAVKLGIAARWAGMAEDAGVKRVEDFVGAAGAESGTKP